MKFHFQKAILDLSEAGISQSEIGRQIGMSRSGVCDIKKEKNQEPTGTAAILLYLLHESKVGPMPVRE